MNWFLVAAIVIAPFLWAGRSITSAFSYGIVAGVGAWCGVAWATTIFVILGWWLGGFIV